MFNPLGAPNTWVFAIAVVQWAVELHDLYISEPEEQKRDSMASFQTTNEGRNRIINLDDEGDFMDRLKCMEAFELEGPAAIVKHVEAKFKIVSAKTEADFNRMDEEMRVLDAKMGAEKEKI